MLPAVLLCLQVPRSPIILTATLAITLRPFTPIVVIAITVVPFAPITVIAITVPVIPITVGISTAFKLTMAITLVFIATFSIRGFAIITTFALFFHLILHLLPHLCLHGFFVLRLLFLIMVIVFGIAVALFCIRGLVIIVIIVAVFGV